MKQNLKKLNTFSVEEKQWADVNQDTEWTSLDCNDFVQTKTTPAQVLEVQN